MQEDKMETDLAKGIEDDLDITDIAKRLAPRGAEPFNTPAFTAQQQGKKRMLTPVEHMAESLGNLNKAFIDLQALYVRLLGESGSLGKPASLKEPQTDTKKPIVTQMHDQCDEVSGKSQDMSTLIAAIRDKL